MFVRIRRACSSAGFTLVELLVVIAIIGILVALLLPAIQAAREAARRTQCQSHMKNIALAMLNYDSANKRFPAGFVVQDSKEESWGWPTFTLPYLEEQALYDRLDPRKRRLADVFIAGTADAQQLALLQTPLPIFRCASDTTPPLIPITTPLDAITGQRTVENGRWERHFNGNNSPKNFQPSTSNYVGNKGFINSGCPIDDSLRCANNGIFYGNSKVSIRKITDGTSHTFLLGERDSFCLSATWIGVRNPPGSDMFGSAWVVGRVTLKLNHPFTGDHDTCTEGFSSKHSGGAFFAFCDGSVNFVNDDVESDLAGNKDNCWVDNPTDTTKECKPLNGTKQIGVYQRLGWMDDGMVITSY